MLKYKVVISWGDEFIFDNGEEALNFARTAAYSSTVENRNIRIDLLWQEPEKDENDEEGDE